MTIEIRNSKFTIEPGENKVAWEYINSGLWEKATFDILDFFTTENSIVIDLGAWSGVISLYLANKIKKAYAIDPDPICFKELRKNISLNPTFETKIITHQVAISDKKEKVKLSARTTYGQSSSSILSRKRDLENSFEISSISLLDFIVHEQINKVDFIKMDIEGAEFKVLPNIGIALSKMDYPTLFISFHYGFLKENIYTQKISSIFINKLILKIEKITRLNVFKIKIDALICKLWKDLEVYKFVYTEAGEEISINFIKENPSFIKYNNLVFTNIEWKQNTFE